MSEVTRPIPPIPPDNSPPPTHPVPVPLPVPLGESAPKCVIIMGGTFDPVHIGHVELPRRVRAEIEKHARCDGRAWLVFVPAARSPHKSSGPVASDDDRVKMLNLALEGVERAAVWTDEIERGGGGAGPGGEARARQADVKQDAKAKERSASYTVETLERARRWLDEQGLSGCDVRLIIGADQAAAFHTWRQPRDILRLAKPAVMMRGGGGGGGDGANGTDGADGTRALMKRLEATRFWSTAELEMWREAIVPVGEIDVSATQVRTALARGDIGAIGKVLPKKVAAFILEKGLYRGS